MKLHRHIGLVALTLFGVGDILGAGIYGLVGKAAGQMGNASWLAFLVSAIAAILTGLTYATLGSRFPKAAGASFVMEKTFHRPWIAYFVGLAVLGSALTSMATAARVLTGYLAPLVAINVDGWVAPLIVGAIALVVFWGIRESLWINAICTLIELSGLLFIIAIGIGWIGSVDYLNAVTPSNPSGEITFGLILSGAVLTFYSFLGFEDILNVAEEVKDPTRTLPRGLLAAVAISSLIYIVVTVVAVSVVPIQELASSPQPLVEVVARAAPWFPKGLYSAIAIFAVCNTLLLNFVMSSRLIYGMARQDLLPKFLGKIHPVRQTPHWSTLIIFLIVILLVQVGAVTQLARATSTLLLLSFFVMNLALVILQRRLKEPVGSFETQRWVPVSGAILCAILLAHTQTGDWVIAGGILTFIALLYLLHRPRQRLGHTVSPE